MATDSPVRFAIRFTNRLAAPRTLVLEPWTGEYHLGPGAQLEIVVEGTSTSPLEVELDGDQIVVSAFDAAGAMLTAYRDGRELRSEHTPPAG